MQDGRAPDATERNDMNTYKLLTPGPPTTTAAVK